MIPGLAGIPVARAQLEVLDENQAPGRTMAQQATKERQIWITADHSRHAILQNEFNSGPEVTKACLSCHELAAGQFHKTIHWTWLDPNVPAEERIGKAGHSINNFCINLNGNEPRCTSCHAGYGWRDSSFNFNDEAAVDCLVCHEQTGTYKKFPTGAGNPVQKPTVFKGNNKTYNPPDWNAVAQSVGRPTRTNCGTCHFYGGGGDGVKHGDIDSSLAKPNKALDVHMGLDGQNFDCVRCHTTTLHNIAGRTYATPAATHRKSLIEDDLASKIMCESCHSSTPHKPGVKANDHTDKVACQSCHIPEFARVNATKMAWDWSKAGQKKDGKPLTLKGTSRQTGPMTPRRASSAGKRMSSRPISGSTAPSTPLPPGIPSILPSPWPSTGRRAAGPMKTPGFFPLKCTRANSPTTRSTRRC